MDTRIPIYDIILLRVQPENSFGFNKYVTQSDSDIW